MALFRKAQSVNGYVLPGRRLTVWALYYFLLYFGAPVIAVAFILDLILFAFFRYELGTCFGVFCLFD